MLRRSLGPCVAALLLFGCGPRDDLGVDTHDAPLDRFRARLLADGWAVGDGAITFAEYSGCCDPGAQCLGNNPTSAYPMWALPPAPGDDPVPGDLFAAWGDLPDGLNRTFHLRADEAVVWIGATPPEQRYFGLRSYLVTRAEPTGPRPVTGSLGPSLNQLVIAAERGTSVDAIWGAPIVVVTTIDRAVEQRVLAHLTAAGFDRDTIHLDRIPGELVRPGVGADADTFAVLARTAMPTDPDADAAWRDPAAHVVLRLTPAPGTPADPHPWPELPARGSGADESAWAEAVDRLEAAILASHPEEATSTQTLAPTWWETLTCITDDPSCVGDLRDRYTAVTAPFLLEGDERVVVFGVNHARVGKAAYGNVAVMQDEHGMGVVALDDEEMVGTARVFLPDDPLADDLYAWTIARSCAGVVGRCVEIPTGCPGVSSGRTMHVTVRAYLELATGAAPLPEELVLDRAIKIWPTSEAP